MIDVVLATANPHKADEIRAVLEPLGFEVRERPDWIEDVEETETTLEGNSLLKARAINAATGAAALADDTGLFVEALGGAPGVFSARYAGESATYQDNVDKLLDALAEVPTDRRGAYFETVIALVFADGTAITASGRVEGTIAEHGRGEGGFGYDPVFLPVEGGGRTLAEMTPDEKNAISHRARALHALAARLAS